MADDIKLLQKLFVCRKNTTGRTVLVDSPKEGEKQKARVTTEKRESILDDFENHYYGKVCLGASPILESNNCYWAAIDVDEYPFDIVAFSKRYADFPFVPVSSKSKGLHIYFFFKTREKAVDVVNCLREVAFLLGFKTPEIFPKQTKLHKEAQANWINLPYYNRGNVQHAIVDGNELSLDEFLSVAQNKEIDGLVKTMSERFDLVGAPPCLQKIAVDGVEEGNRDIFLFNLCTFYRKKYADDWQSRIREANTTYLSKPLSDKKVEQDIITQQERKKVWYQCKTDLLGFCNDKVCKKRIYGCYTKADPTEIMGKLIKIKTDPVSWTMEIGDQEILYDSTTEIMDQTKFRERCVEILNLLPVQMKKQEWEYLLQQKLDAVEERDAPKDASIDAELYEHLKEFVINHSSIRDALSDAVMEMAVFNKKEKINYFRSSILLNYLKKKRITYTPGKLYNKLSKIGCVAQKKRLDKYQTINVWTIPAYPEQLVEVKIEPMDWEKVDKKLQDKETF